MIDNENTNTEFKILGMSIENLSIIYGVLLICWGIIISFISGSDSLTSFIPSFLGFPIFIFSYLSVKFINKKKFFMHIVVLLGLMIFIVSKPSLNISFILSSLKDHVIVS